MSQELKDLFYNNVLSQVNATNTTKDIRSHSGRSNCELHFKEPARFALSYLRAYLLMSKFLHLKTELKPTDAVGLCEKNISACSLVGYLTWETNEL